MSVEATFATFKLTKKQVTPTEKLFLLSCANRSGENFECWPSLKRLIEDTGLDRKTIIKIRQSVIEKKLLEYTGEYCGHSKQIPIMRLTYVNALEQILNDHTSTKIGTSPKSGTSTKNGTGTSTNFGTGTSTTFGTLNLKEETVRLKKEGTSCEAPDFDYNAHPEKQNPKEDRSLKSDNFTDLTVFPAFDHETNKQVIDSTEVKVRSDYFENHLQKETQCKNKSHLDLNDLLDDNIFDLPEQLISDWLENRRKKRLALTKTSWSQITKKLKELSDMGINPVDAFEKMVASGWQSLEIHYFMSKEQLSKHAQAKKRSLELEQRAQQQKKKEIESAKNFKAIVSQVGLAERNKLRGMLGMSLRA